MDKVKDVETSVRVFTISLDRSSLRPERDMQDPGKKEKDVSKRLQKKTRCFFASDFITSLLIIAPLVVFYWRGVWQLQDIYITPHNFAFSAWISFAVGLFITTLLLGLQDALEKAFPAKRWVVFVIASRLYSVLYAFGNVCHWRGVWFILDHYSTRQWESYVATAAGGIGLLSALRASGYALAPPVLIVPDGLEDGYFQAPTRFKTTSKSVWKFFLDVLFTQWILESLVVAAWRGLWGIADLFFFPDSPTWTAWISMIIGYGIAVIVIPIAYALPPAHKFWKRLLANWLLNTVGLFVAVHVWRGVWYLQNLYLLPQDYPLSNWISTAIGIVLLLVLRAKNATTVRPGNLDGGNSIGFAYEIDFWRKTWCNSEVKCSYENQKEKEEVQLKSISYVAPQSI